ncbi:unnamed protein product [Paramecium octaurelia]|uniref:Uncharacterized protein n=1 Tax=Paramecium octaurelia TaxID=43137 RepID=A0A8S1WDW4_PAROT|nr:unnamed protein product [Paramecium octaurelia]CAD8187221.1 unnamed protein product [Paramecium octaurelia]
MVEFGEESKKQERGHFFYPLIILCATSILEAQYIDQECDLDLALFTHLVFYGNIVMTVYTLVSFLPRGENLILNLVFAILGICCSLYMFSLLIYGFTLFLSDNDCVNEAPVLYFFLQFYVLANGITFIIVVVVIIGVILKILIDVCRGR